MNTYVTIMEALLEIRKAYEAEITKWYRIRRRAAAHGCTVVPDQILNEIYKAQRDISHEDYRDFTYQYKFLFQIDDPYREPNYHTRVSEIEW